MMKSTIAHEELLTIGYKENLLLLKRLLKDDLQSFLFIANIYITDKSLSPEKINKIFEGGLKRNYRFNKQQND